jgi:hypothetical protein
MPDDDGQKPVDADAETMDEVKKRLWALCQTRIRPEPIKAPFVKRNLDAEQPPSQRVLGGQELETPSWYIDDFGSGGLIVEDFELAADHDPYDALPEVLDDPDHLELGDLLQVEPYMSEDAEFPPDEWTGSSEGDYFYTDGQGNVYPIERQAAPEDDQVDWPSTPQLLNSEGLDHTVDENQEEDWDGGGHQTYIMYDEMQHWPPTPGVHIHARDDQPYQLPHPDDGPFRDFAGD